MLTPDQLAQHTTVEAVDQAIDAHRALLDSLVGQLFPPLVRAELLQLWECRGLLLFEERMHARREREANESGRLYESLEIDGYILPGTEISEG